MVSQEKHNIHHQLSTFLITAYPTLYHTVVHFCNRYGCHNISNHLDCDFVVCLVKSAQQGSSASLATVYYYYYY